MVALIKARQANYKEIGGSFKAINDELKSDSPDLNSIKSAARDVADRSVQTLKYFPRGSGPESGVVTRAKADIWANPADFSRIQNDMIAAAKMLNIAAAAGDIAGIQKARASLGATCKACHDKNRQPT